MTDLFWPGDERAGDLLSENALLAAMVEVEAAWLSAMVEAGLAPSAALDDLAGLISGADVEAVAAQAESGGNPVLPLLALLRARLTERNQPAAQCLHRGLTSQDVIDSALMICARDAAAQLNAELTSQIRSLGELAEQHRYSVLAGRTLTQHAVPITFGLKAALWLQGLLDAADDLDGLSHPAQFGGAAGTLAATAELARAAGHADSSQVALDVARYAASTLGLAPAVPWHTSRAAITRLGDALVGCTDAWGRIANDVLLLSRPEIAELTEPVGRGGSSTMPQKANPILSVLIRRAALAAPLQSAQLHVAAASYVDERPDGAWHVEWATLRTLGRHTLVAGSQTSELLAGLQVDVARMATTAEAAAGLLAEQASLTGRAPTGPASYLGASEEIIDAVLARARPHLEEIP